MQEKKKILYIITKGNFGGAQRYVYDLATHLPQDRFEAVVACGPDSAKATTGKEGLIGKLKEANIRTIKLDGLGREINPNKDLDTVRNLIKIIKEEKPDIIHLNSSKIGFLGSVAILYLRILNLFRASNFEFRALFTSHGWGFYEKDRSLISRIIFYIAHYFTVLVCDLTIAVSQKTKLDIAFLPSIKDKIVVIHNGIESFDLLPKKESDKVVLFSIAELHKNKGLDIALKGIALLPKEIQEKITYSIAGSGEEKENLEKLAEELKISERVNFLGFIDNAKQLLSGADIFLFPSRTENLPYAILEAGLAGLPIISTSVGGIPEIIKDMQNGILIHPQNPKEIAEAILYMLDHPEKSKEFGQEIQKTVSNFFSLSKMLSETIDLYSK